MAKKEKVIFDTNRLYNKHGTTFLAKSICDLNNFSKVSNIVLPDMVI
jgi:adenosylmethionine-8-amino-7-oxononanoate aminotransferase